MSGVSMEGAAHGMRTWLPLQAKVLTSADCATMQDEILSPSERIADAGGPMNTMPFSFSRSC